MNESRYVVSQYCDDVRQEIGGKYSLMGCYGEELIVDNFPTVLPKLCIQIRIFTPMEKPFEKLIFRAFMNDDVVAELTAEHIQITQSNISEYSVTAIMVIAPLQINERSKISTEVDTGDAVISANSLTIRERQPHDAPVR